MHLIVVRAAAVPESGMPEIKIVTEVAGRICALPVQVGGSEDLKGGHGAQYSDEEAAIVEERLKGLGYIE